MDLQALRYQPHRSMWVLLTGARWDSSQTAFMFVHLVPAVGMNNITDLSSRDGRPCVFIENLGKGFVTDGDGIFQPSWSTTQKLHVVYCVLEIKEVGTLNHRFGHVLR